MGRYYNGDINGKFWFAVQSSVAPSRFGGEEYEPSHIEYHFGEEHLEEIEEEIKKIKKSLGKYKENFDKFFEKNDFYNDEMLEEFFKEKEIETKNINSHLENYADLGLGQEILDCVKKNGECNFEAEI